MPERAPESPPEQHGPLGPPRDDVADPAVVRRRGVLLVAGFGLVLVCVATLGLVAGMVRRQEQDALDTVGNTVLHGLRSPVLDAVMNTATAVGTNWVLVPVAFAAVVVLARAGHRREALFVATTLAGSIVLNSAMKLFFQRPRPSLPWATVLPDYSFPSGHSMNSMALGLALALVSWRLLGPRWGSAAVVVAVLGAGLIGLSRIYLGYHYVTDVVGGFASGVLWVAITIAVFRAGRSWRPMR